MEAALVRRLLLGFIEEATMKWKRTRLSEEDIRFEYRVMQRWCRLFRKTPIDWVALVAQRFRERHPPATVEKDCA
jgi:hypothetical protein